MKRNSNSAVDHTHPPTQHPKTLRSTVCSCHLERDTNCAGSWNKGVVHVSTATLEGISWLNEVAAEVDVYVLTKRNLPLSPFSLSATEVKHTQGQTKATLAAQLGREYRKDDGSAQEFISGASVTLGSRLLPPDESVRLTATGHGSTRLHTSSTRTRILSKQPKDAQQALLHTGTQKWTTQGSSHSTPPKPSQLKLPLI